MPSLDRAICLKGFRRNGKSSPIYTLLPATGEVITLPVAGPGSVCEPEILSGFGDLRRGKSSVFAPKQFYALYADDESLYLWLGGKRFDALRDDVRAQRQSLLGSLHRFRVWAQGTLHVDVIYWYPDDVDVPPNDIFWYIADRLETPERRRSTVSYWREQHRRAG
jgi:hypothetical protein